MKEMKDSKEYWEGNAGYYDDKLTLLDNPYNIELEYEQYHWWGEGFLDAYFERYNGETN